MLMLSALPLLVALSGSIQQPQDAGQAALAELRSLGFEDSGPGAIIAAARGGDVEILAALGQANLEEQAPVTAETLFASPYLARQVVRTLALILESEGRLDLEQPLASALEEFAHLGPEILLQHILSHTSGLRDVRTVLDARGKGEGQTLLRADALRWAARQRQPLCLPGERTIMASTNDLILAEILVRTEGRSLAQIANERLFAPLGMTSTSFVSDGGNLPGAAATPYLDPSNGAGMSQGPGQGRILGDRGLWLSVRDLCLWGAELLAPEVLPPGVAKAVRTRAFDMGGESLRSNRFGYATTWRGQKVSALASSSDGFCIHLNLYPEQDWVVAALSNGGPWRGLQSAAQAAAAVRLAGVLDPADEQPKLGGRFGKPGKRCMRRKLGDFDSAGLVGAYQVPELGLELVLRLDSANKLRCSIDGGDEVWTRPKTSEAYGPQLILGFDTRNHVDIERTETGGWRVTTLDWIPPATGSRLEGLVLERAPGTPESD